MSVVEQSDKAIVKAIVKEIGQRFKTLRLHRNLTQKQLGDKACLSESTIKSLENGSSAKLTTIIAVLRELKSLDQLTNFIPETTISPIQMAKMQGNQRQRASGTPAPKKDESEW